MAVFGVKYKGKTIVSRCSYSVVYADTAGKRDWRWLFASERLNKLRELYQHNIIINKVKQIYYPDGKIEMSQNFKKGRLNGIRKIYYPGGQLYVTEKFKEGRRVGYRNIYLSSGQLIQQTLYKNNLIRQVTAYQDTAEAAWYINFKIPHNKDPFLGDEEHGPEVYVRMLDSLRKLKNWATHISFKRKFLPDGRSYTLEMYDYKGDTSGIGYLDWNKRIKEHTEYRNSKIEYTVKYDQLNNSQVEHDYNRKGGRRDFIKQCESCKFFFNEKDAPEATPEAIYF